MEVRNVKINKEDFTVEDCDMEGATFLFLITKKNTFSSVLIKFSVALLREKKIPIEVKNFKDLKEFKEFEEPFLNQAYSYLYTHEGKFEAVFRANSSPEDFENIVEKSE